MDKLSANPGTSLNRASHLRRGTRAAGFTLIEVIIASAVLVVGVLAMSGLVATAVQSNGHNRLDSTAVMLTQAVVEQVNTGLNYTPYTGTVGTTTAYLTDCGSHGSGNPWEIDSGEGGPTLTNGTFNWSDPKVAGYHMDYVVCNGNNQTTYDIRWNIKALSGTSSHTSLITVATRMEGGGMGPITFPIYMRVLVGPDPPHGL
jgi:prepilin-type N-terminal cleavage/methylation domain-containing protein